MAKRTRTTKRTRSAGKKTIQPVDIGPLIEHAQLRWLRLRKSESVLIGIPESAPELNQAINIEAGPGDAEKAAILVRATFTLDGPDAIRIEATFEILYGYDEALTISPEQMQAFAHFIGVNNTWPYWREFVQSTTSRMGLPPLTLPLIRIDLARPQAQQPQKTEKPQRKKRVSKKKKREKT